MKECKVCGAKLGEKNKSGLCVEHWKMHEKQMITAGYKPPQLKAVRNCKCGAEIRKSNKSGLCGVCSDVRYASWQNKKRCLMCNEISQLNHLKVCPGCAKRMQVDHDGV